MIILRKDTHIQKRCISISIPHGHLTTRNNKCAIRPYQTWPFRKIQNNWKWYKRHT